MLNAILKQCQAQYKVIYKFFKLEYIAYLPMPFSLYHFRAALLRKR